MSHQPINSFDLLMRSAPLLCVTAFLFFLFGIGLASFVFNAYAEQEIKVEKNATNFTSQHCKPVSPS